VRTLAVVIPVFNAESTIAGLIDEVVATLEPHFDALEIVAVNDGSDDGSHESLLAAHRRHPSVVKYVRLARNFGEHNAVMCGLRYTVGDAVAIIDDDLQNPPGEILTLVEELRRGHDVVYSKYEGKMHAAWRNLGSRFNNLVATRLLRKPPGLYLSSFKVMNRFLVDSVLRYDGPFPYLDGLILRSTSAIGTRSCAHEPRAAGKSNYTLVRLLRLWLNMFTSFSLVPLRISTFLGLFMSAVGVLLALFFVFSWLAGGVFLHETVPPGWASTVVLITVFAGIQLLMLGVIGEYLGRVLLTNNREPQFIVREVYPRPGQDADGRRGPAAGQE
jgi:undecaprenyl-phosphate 4-deoxy-4-formamido-L-arabinose transferase